MGDLNKMRSSDTKLAFPKQENGDTGQIQFNRKPYNVKL